MNMQYLIIMTGIVYGKRFCKTRNWTSTTILSSMNNLHSTRLTDWKDLMPRTQTSFSLAVCFFIRLIVQNMQIHILPPAIYRIISQCLQMYLKDLLSSGHTLQCQICFPAFGSMKLTGSPLVINWVLPIHIRSWEGRMLANLFILICSRLINLWNLITLEVNGNHKRLSERIVCVCTRMEK